MLKWSYGIYLIVIIFMVVGVSLLKENIRWSWNLNRRAYLRNGFTNSIKRYKGWYDVRTSKEGSPLNTIIKIIKKNRSNKMDKEIFEAISFLRNMAAIGRGKTTSTDFIIQKLAEHKGLLQPIYVKMLSLLRLNKKEDNGSHCLSPTKEF